MINKVRQRQKRHYRAKNKISNGNPRLVVFRSNLHIYAQIIDDYKSKTLAASSDLKIKDKKDNRQKAYEVGLNLAREASKKKIKKIVFDRAGYKYHGRVKALAEGARKGGLNF